MIYEKKVKILWLLEIRRVHIKMKRLADEKGAAKASRFIKQKRSSRYGAAAGCKAIHLCTEHVSII